MRNTGSMPVLPTPVLKPRPHGRGPILTKANEKLYIRIPVSGDRQHPGAAPLPLPLRTSCPHRRHGGPYSPPG